MRINVFKDISKVKLDAWKGLSVREIGWGVLFSLIIIPSAIASMLYFNTINIGMLFSLLIVLPLAFVQFFNAYNMNFKEFIRKFIQLRKGNAIIYYMPNEADLIMEEKQKGEKDEKAKIKYFRFFRKR